MRNKLEIVKIKCYNIAASLTSKNYCMKQLKNDAASFKKSTPFEMSKIGGGIWVTIIRDGKSTTVWMPE